MALFERDRSALIVIDVQQAFDEWEQGGRRRNNPDALERIQETIDTFRRVNATVVHVRHASKRPGSKFAAGAPGYEVQAAAAERADEPVVVQHVNSAFIGTCLELELRAREVKTLFIVGATTNHCVETTTRTAGNLGYDARIVADATCEGK